MKSTRCWTLRCKPNISNLESSHQKKKMKSWQKHETGLNNKVPQVGPFHEQLVCSSIYNNFHIKEFEIEACSLILIRHASEELLRHKEKQNIYKKNLTQRQAPWDWGGDWKFRPSSPSMLYACDNAQHKARDSAKPPSKKSLHKWMLFHYFKRKRTESNQLY